MALVAENVDYKIVAGPTTTATFSYALQNPNAGANRTLLIFFAGDNPDSATYDGIPLAGVAVDTSPFCALYIIEDSILATDTTPRDIVFTFAGNRTNQAILIAEFSGAKQLGAAPPGACNSLASSDTHPVNLTTTVDGVPVVLFYLRVENRTMNDQPSGTPLLSEDNGGAFDGQRIILATGPTPAGLQTYTFDSSDNSNGRVGAVQLEEAAAATGVEASGDLTMPAMTLGGTADVAVQADGGLSLPMLTLAATGTVQIGASGVLSLPMLTLAADAAVGVTAGAQLLLPSLVLAAQADVAIAAAAQLLLPMLVLSGVGHGPGVTASGALTLPAMTLGAAATVAQVGRRYITGSVRTRPLVTGLVRTRPMVRGAVAMRPIVTGSVRTRPAAGVAPGPETGGNLVLPMLTLTGAVDIPVQVAAQLVMPMLQLAASGAVTVEGQAALSLPMLTLTGSGTVADAVVPLLHTFTGSDDPNSVGVSDSGHVAQVFGGTWGRIGGQCYRSAPALNSFIFWDVGASDGDCEVTFVVRGPEIGRLAVRATDGDNCYFFNSSVGNFVRRQGGANTTIGSTSAFADGDVCMIRCAGTTLELFRNGVSVLTLTGQTFNQTATMHGLGCFGSGGNASRFDDLSFTPA